MIEIILSEENRKKETTAPFDVYSKTTALMIKLRNECITPFFPSWDYCNGKILDRYGDHLKDVQNRGR